MDFPLQMYYIPKVWDCQAVFKKFWDFVYCTKFEVILLYNPTKTAERIKSIAKSNGVILKQMLIDCQLSKNTLSSMLSGGSMPKSENLGAIADYLDVSVDYLLGRTDNPQAHKSSNTVSVGDVSGNSGAIGVGNMVTNNAVPIDEHQKLLLDLYNKLSPIEQIELIASLNNRKT